MRERNPVPLAHPFTYYSGKHSAQIQQTAAQRGDIGLVVTPSHPEYVQWAKNYPAIFVDNGAFGKNGFNPEAFRKLVDRLAALPEDDRRKVQFIVAPDVVGDAEATLARFPSGRSSSTTKAFVWPSSSRTV